MNSDHTCKGYDCWVCRDPSITIGVIPVAALSHWSGNKDITTFLIVHPVVYGIIWVLAYFW
jgi:hypothetical protein